MRLDVYLSTSGLVKSRSRAREWIEGGCVTVNGKTVFKPAWDVGEGDAVLVTHDVHPYVSRGGMKLAGALDAFGLDVRGRIAVDIGASSGGFTDCLLRRGAAHVYAVDSGSDQLDPALAADARVTNIERYNARDLTAEDLGERCDIAVADLSFISQTYIIPRLPSVLKDGGAYIGLIKPQFECGREALGKGGIVKDSRFRAQAITRVLSSLEENGLGALALIPSPILGGDGNREYLVYARRGEAAAVTETTIREVVT